MKIKELLESNDVENLLKQKILMHGKNVELLANTDKDTGVKTVFRVGDRIRRISDNLLGVITQLDVDGKIITFKSGSQFYVTGKDNIKDASKESYRWRK